ncbi:eCIS core domain-containing protein [Mesorhizobium sp. LjNodule214]|uniref:eCIS core domain-containing protein n=1 Tax=Mesorhizobium sp. LjNodule214 TaxID=3342252 RepID=UPI003ED07AE1
MKTRLGPVDDPLEREADRIASTAVGGPIAPASSPPSKTAQRKCAACGEEKIQRKPVDAAARAASTGGTPLTAQQRAYFEPRFGRDFSNVRLHLGGEAATAAEGINARAYTFGTDIAFASGEFAPGTQAGTHLLAHELAHVGQQTGDASIRRKIRSDAQAPLDTYLSGKGIQGFTVKDNVYGATKGGATYFEQELLFDMLGSPRVFDVDGGDPLTAAKSLNAHLAARTGIVTFAAQKKYTFASVTNFKMNPKYYDVNPAKLKWSMKQGVDRQAAWDDLNANPTLYAIGCAAATVLTQGGGSKGAKFEDKPSADETDWVAGDAGYITNTKFQQGADIGLLGENIIYTGSGQFWGHFSDNVTYKSLAGWKGAVASWHGRGAADAAEVDPKREIPMTGLL